MAQYGIKEVMDLVFTDYNPRPYLRKPILNVDYAEMTEIGNEAERIDVHGGRGNAKLMSFDHSKTTEVSLTLPLVDLEMLALISGDEVEEKIKQIFKKEVVILEDGTEANTFKAILDRIPIENSVYVYTLEGNRDNGMRFCPAEDTVTMEDNEFSVDAENKTLTIKAGTDLNLQAGDEVNVYYHAETVEKVTTLQINPTKFPKAISFYGETLFRNQFSEVDEVYNVVGHKGRIRPEYTLSMSGTDVAVLELTIDMFAAKDDVTKEDIYIEYIKDEISETEDMDECDRRRKERL